MTAFQILMDLIEDPNRNGDYRLNIQGEELRRLWQAVEQADCNSGAASLVGRAEITVPKGEEPSPMANELIKYLDSIDIHSDNIGDIRRARFVPWSSEWNRLARDETAKRERHPVLWRCPTCGHVMTEEQSKGYRSCPTGVHLVQHEAIAVADCKPDDLAP